MISLDARQREILKAIAFRPGIGCPQDYRKYGWPWQTMRFLERHGLVERGHSYRVERWTVDGKDTGENWHDPRMHVRITQKGRDTLRLSSDG